MLRRHLSRASSKLLPSDTSLYNAMQAIIGQELRARYESLRKFRRKCFGFWRIIDEQAFVKKSQASSGKQEVPDITLSTLIAAVEHES